MAFDRNRFQAAKLEVNKKTTEEVDKIFKPNFTRGDYHSIDEGKNYFRMMPPHNSDEPSMQPKVIYWLDCKVEEIKNDKSTGTFVIKPRPIFDSRVHGGTPKDIIDEYINFTKKVIFETVQDKEERLKLLSPINGWRSKDGKWNPGILPNQSFVCYATKGEIKPENLGRLELWKRDKDTLEKLNISEESDEPIVTDMFSHPTEGTQFVITKGRNNKGELFTLITKNSFDVKNVKDISKAYEEWKSSQIVSDEVLEKLSEMEPLSKQFKNAYKRSDFEKALTALQMFDEKHGYLTFQNQNFIDIVEEIDSYYSDVLEVTTSEENVVSKSDYLDINEMTRSELKDYIKQNKLPITVVGSMNEDIIRELIYQVESSNEEKSEVIVEEKEEVFNKEKTESVGSSEIESLKERLARLKKEKK